MNNLKPGETPIQVARWMSPSDVRAEIVGHQSWTPETVVNEIGLSQSLLFLERDMGLLDILGDYLNKVSERAEALFKFDGEIAEEARKAHDKANGTNGHFQSAVCSTIALAHAKGLVLDKVATEAVGPTLNDAFLYDHGKKDEELALANILFDVLRAKGLV